MVILIRQSSNCRLSTVRLLVSWLSPQCSVFEAHPFRGDNVITQKSNLETLALEQPYTWGILTRTVLIMTYDLSLDSALIHASQ